MFMCGGTSITFKIMDLDSDPFCLEVTEIAEQLDFLCERIQQLSDGYEWREGLGLEGEGYFNPFIPTLEKLNLCKINAEAWKRRRKKKMLQYLNSMRRF